MAFSSFGSEENSKEKDLKYTCNLCNKVYYYSSQEVEYLMSKTLTGFITCPNYHLLIFPERIKDNDK